MNLQSEFISRFNAQNNAYFTIINFDCEVTCEKLPVECIEIKDDNIYMTTRFGKALLTAKYNAECFTDLYSATDNTKRSEIIVKQVKETTKFNNNCSF